jgi:hypothetical protein
MDARAWLVAPPYRLADLLCEARHPELRITMTGTGGPADEKFYVSCVHCKVDAREHVDALLGGGPS